MESRLGSNEGRGGTRQGYEIFLGWLEETEGEGILKRPSEC